MRKRDREVIEDVRRLFSFTYTYVAEPPVLLVPSQTVRCHICECKWDTTKRRTFVTYVTRIFVSLCRAYCWALPCHWGAWPLWVGFSSVQLVVFYICSFVHRNSRLNKSNKMQQYADMYLLLNYSTCFGRPSRLSSGVHKTVITASGTDHTIWEASFFKRDQIRTILSLLKKLASQIVWSVPEAATTVLCTPDDRRDGRPKHVE